MDLKKFIAALAAGYRKLTGYEAGRKAGHDAGRAEGYEAGQWGMRDDLGLIAAGCIATG